MNNLVEALKKAKTALDDWLNIYASEFCDEKRVKEARERVHERGTLSYIATNLEIIKDALDEHDDGVQLLVEMLEEWIKGSKATLSNCTRGVCDQDDYDATYAYIKKSEKLIKKFKRRKRNHGT